MFNFNFSIYYIGNVTDLIQTGHFTSVPENKFTLF